MTISNASAVWDGGFRNGTGRYQAGSGAFSGGYSFTTRFEGAKGSTPEELIAAAHAACFSMALAAGLERGGHAPTSIRTNASCALEKVGEGFKITRMRLQVTGTVPGLDPEAFAKAAEAAKQGCPVSGALKGNVEIEMEAKLEG